MGEGSPSPAAAARVRRTGARGRCGTVGRVVVERGAVKALVSLALVAGAVVLLRRHREQQPTKDVWHEATTSS
ncbi:DLW-39 family protein [Actinomycetospora lutea]|uniref:DLW-39 family protein n=1 Tax=Actinomycetospora lutea TaxID=663604 RepID=UPI003B66B870